MQHDDVFKRNNIVEQKVKHGVLFDRRRHIDALQRAVKNAGRVLPRALGEIGHKEFARLGNQRGHLGLDHLSAFMHLVAELDDSLDARHR